MEKYCITPSVNVTKRPIGREGELPVIRQFLLSHKERNFPTTKIHTHADEDGNKEN